MYALLFRVYVTICCEASKQTIKNKKKYCNVLRCVMYAWDKYTWVCVIAKSALTCAIRFAYPYVIVDMRPLEVAESASCALEVCLYL